MKTKVLLVAFLLIAIVGALSGAQARPRQSCFEPSVGVMGQVITTPRVCVPCVMGQPFCAPPPSSDNTQP